MREMKHSKKLAFAVLAAVTAVGANVNPVDAASVVMDNTNVVTGANNAVAYGSGNTVKESDANFRDRDYENEPDDATKKTGDWKSNSVAIGVNNTAAGTSALAMGNSSKALMNESIAIGHSAEAQRTWSTAIGTRAKASEVRSQAIGYEALASGYKSNAIGSGAQATNNHSVAMGSSALASGDHSQAFGAGAQATNVRSNAFGSDANAAADYALAIGDHANATHLNSIALGTGSTTSEATAQSSATIARHTFGGFAGVGSASNGSVSVGKAGAERQIKNVAAGEISATSTDAVNGSQLYSVANDLQTQINNSTPGQINNNIKNLTNRVGTVERRVNKVGAGSAALAALHPLDFNPDDKWTIAAGYGHYHNANSAALGAFYRPNEDVQLSIGSTVGSDETVFNAGLSVKVGAHSNVSRSRVAIGKEVLALKKTVAEQNAQIQKLTALLNGVAGTKMKADHTTLFPDVAANHWAYEAVSDLSRRGLVEGYPDGSFGGDRMLTRYEFAQIVYRAIQDGVTVDDRLVTEFSPEMALFRVDTVAKNAQGEPTIERVRVNKK